MEDIKLVIQSLQYKEEEEQAGEKNISLENTYAYVYDCYDKQDKIFKVFFELTYACNLKCEHCYLSTDINSSKTKITLKKAKEVIDQLRELGVVDITFTGGELFSHPDALEIIEYACRYNFIISILTNGTLLNRNMIKKLCELPISNIRISMYGMEEFHDNFVGVKGAFKKSLDTLKMLNEYRKGICTANSVITKDSVEDLLKLNKILKDIGIEHRLTPMIYPTVHGDLAPTKLRISEEEITQLLKEGIVDYTGSSCNSGISRLRISPNGDINPCELFREVSFGNIFEHSISEIIHSEKRCRWIHHIREQLKKSECASCDKKQYCPRCLGVAYLENGNFVQKADGLCVLAEAKARSLEV